MILIKWTYFFLPEFEKVKLEKDAHSPNSCQVFLRIELEANRKDFFCVLYLVCLKYVYVIGEITYVRLWQVVS